MPNIKKSKGVGSIAALQRLSRAVREELNRRLDRGDDLDSVQDWLNKLPEVVAVFGDNDPVSLRTLREWRRVELPCWRAREAFRSRVVQELRAWASNDVVLHAWFGPRKTLLESVNEGRLILGLEPVTHDQLPEDEDWDYIPTRAERKQALNDWIRRSAPGYVPTKEEEDIDPMYMLPMPKKKINLNHPHHEKTTH